MSHPARSSLRVLGRVEKDCGRKHGSRWRGWPQSPCTGSAEGDCPCLAPGGGQGSPWLVDCHLARLLAWSGPGLIPCLDGPHLGSHLAGLPDFPSSPSSTEPRTKAYQFYLKSLFPFIMILLWEISDIRYFRQCPDQKQMLHSKGI